MKKRIIDRLQMLWSLELINVGLLPSCVAFISLNLNFSLSFRDWMTMVPMGIILLQGSVYWRLKLAELEGPPGLLTRFLPWFAWCRVWNWPMIAAMGIWHFWPGGSGGVGWWIGVGAWVLTLLEHVNYFYLQLMHDTVNDWNRLMRDRRLRKSQLAVDLERMKLG